MERSGFPSPIIASTFTINGVTRSVAGSYECRAATYTFPIAEHVAHYAEDYWTVGGAFISNYMSHSYTAAGGPGSLDQNVGPIAAVSGYGYAQWTSLDYVTEEYTEYSYVYLSPNAIYSVSDVVPEPGSWALMVAGFGMVGGAVRRNRRVLVRHTIA